MKRIFTIAIATLIAATSFSQTSKGTWLLGGSAGFNSQKAGSAASVSTIEISPNAGYFISNNLAVGASVMFESESKHHTAFNFGPMVRYYFAEMGKKAKLFAHAGIGFGSTKPEGGSSVSSTTWGVKAGPAFFLSKNIALETTVGYSSLKVKDVADATSNFGVNVGFQIHL
jgi:opacity protein-like surface antigen